MTTPARSGTQDVKCDRVTGLERVLDFANIIHALDRLPVDGQDHVLLSQADVLGERVRIDALDQ